MPFDGGMCARLEIFKRFEGEDLPIVMQTFYIYDFSSNPVVPPIKEQLIEFGKSTYKIESVAPSPEGWRVTAEKRVN